MNRSRLLPLGWLMAWALLIGLLTAWNALAGPPTDQLKPAVEQVIRTLEDPALKPAAKLEDRRRALRALTESMFDWSEMARRALGQHWQARTEAERGEFVGLFRDTIERAYVGKIEGYSGEKITFAGDAVDGDQATVKTRIATKQGELAVDYRMALKSDRWLVYDVNVEGVSLVGNYRTQFNQIIRTSSYEELIRKLKSRSS